MEVAVQEIMLTERKRVMQCTNGRMEVYLKETGIIINYVDK